jgi:ABC-type uncharacterized transport system permease subunit
VSAETLQPIALYITAVLYGLGSVLVLAGLQNRSRRLQHAAMVAMIAGFGFHTIWIGLNCIRTHRAPLADLSEIASFVAWTILAVEVSLFVKYRVHAAAFFVYPLVLMLLGITVAVHTSGVDRDPAFDSRLFVTHLLLTTIGIAALLVGVAFYFLYRFQDQSLKSKRQGPLFEWIPSLQVCEVVSYRSLAIGFGIYTLGLLAGFLWSYRTTAEFFNMRAKETGAVLAWVLFAVLIQSHISGGYRTQKNLVISVVAVLSILVAIFGIQHG